MTAEPTGRSDGQTAVLLLCCAAQALVVLNVTIVSVALTDIGDALAMSTAGQQWVINAYPRSGPCGRRPKRLSAAATMSL